MRAAALIAALLALATTPATAVAEPPPLADGDYELDGEAWNGLSTLAALARGSGLSVVSRQSIDWSELGPSDIVFVLYPTSRIEPAHLAAFVRGGGHVLIADDFGASTEALARLGVLHDESAIGVDAARFHDALPFAPMATARAPDHPLARGVTELATNHPALLPDVSGPEVVFGFGDGEALVAAGSLGAGRFVVLSDPSVLINRMMQFEGNLQFAVNLLRFLASPEGSARLVVLVGDLRFRGEPAGADADGTLGGRMSAALGDFNGWLDGLNDYLLTEDALRALGIALALVIALLAFAVVPPQRAAPLDGRWTRAGRALPQLATPEGAIAHFDRPRSPRAGRRSYALPAAVLRDHLDARLAELLDHPEPLASFGLAHLSRALTERVGKAAALAFARVHPQLRGLPTRGQAASPWETRAVSLRDFERLCDDTEDFYRTLSTPRS